MNDLSLSISDEDREELLVFSRSNALDHRYVVRAKIILALADGASYAQAAKQSGASTSTVGKWKRRFLDDGIDGLLDAPRSGRPVIYTTEDRARVIQKACEKPQGGYSSWSQRRIAEELDMSQSTVHRLLAEDEVQPHKVEHWCGKSPDPEFEPKMLEIVGLYLNPPENALVLCVDEKTQMQALDRTQEELPLRPGNPRRQTATYVRHGTTSFIAALAVHNGEITGQPIERNNSATFLRFLKKLDRKYTNVHLHIIVDNLQVHKTAEVKAWLRRKRKITLHFTPTYSSWLNQIEIWFNLLTRDVIKGAVWKSKQQMIEQIIAYIKTYNNTRAKPFSWTYNGRKTRD